MIVYIVLIGQCRNIDDGLDLVVRDAEHVLDSPSLRRAGSFRNLIYLEPEALALFRKEQHRAVHVGNIEMLDEVVISGSAALHAYAAPVLCLVFRERGPLYISEV